MAHAHLWMLNGKVPEACLDLDRWARWFEKANRQIARTELLGGELVVLTTFRPFSDRRGRFDPPPMLFETAVYGESYLGQMLRRPATMRDRIETRCYATWEESERGHDEIAERYRRLTESAARGTAAAVAKVSTH
jgi:hypothetical protein